ncbi:hypothetical protein [Falsiroseomonas sp. HW251]|uniref:hypothetical protein n=1 Tax=Falsiroseomonas sp. HW251 TaxID=3390998 RepID=UPI003D322B06
MTIRVTVMEENLRPGFERLLIEAWGQTWSADYAVDLIRWRYYERAALGQTWVAIDGTSCVAILDSYLRPYLLNGSRVLVREPCDWFCLPEYRPRGVGVLLMKRLMDCDEPMLSIGGTPPTLAILPRLRWTRLPEVTKLVLPLRVRDFAATALRKWWPAQEPLARLVPGKIPYRWPKRPIRPHEAAHVVEWTPGTPLPVLRGAQDGLVELIEQADADWIAGMPRWLAQAVGLVFFLGEEPVGFTLSQIEPSAAGLDACLVHVQLSDHAQPLVNWIIAETASNLAARGVGIIRCLASSPSKIAALEMAGFFRTTPRPSYWWQRDREPAPTQLDAGYLRADDAVPLAALRGRHLGAPPARAGRADRSAASTSRPR